MKKVWKITSKKLPEAKVLLNILKSEFLKPKKDAMFLTGTLIAAAAPFLIIIKDKFLAEPPSDIMSWIMSCCLIDFFVLSVMSGFIITNSVQKEYQTGAIINIFGSGVSRAAFIFAKLSVWFLWYAALLACIEIITLCGSCYLYPSQFDADFAKTVVVMFTKFGLLAFVTLIPILWITIVQRKLFYPSVLLSLGLSGILAGGFNISEEAILPACIVPWTAVAPISIYNLNSPYNVIASVSIILCGIAGMCAALYSVYKQEL